MGGGVAVMIEDDWITWVLMAVSVVVYLLILFSI